MSGTANDLSATFAYNPASQIVSTVRTGDAYAWTDHANVNVTGTANGLNQLTQVGAKALTHDLRGNVTAFGTESFTYNAENQLLTGPGSTTLSYDPAMRLYSVLAGANTTRFAYDRLDRIAEYNGSDVIQRRYVHGPGMDQPLVQYEGTGTTNRRFLSSDERGSIISITDSSGALLGINRYDEYGNPQSTNLGSFGYTGQAWLAGVNAWYYKARVFDPELGRFLQPDPAGGTNLYAYVGNDPIGFSDPSGMIREWFGMAGDDMSRFIDTAPQGTGRGSRSWDWGGQMATFTGGRLDSITLERGADAWFDLNRLSQRSGVDVGCLLTCSDAIIASLITGGSQPSFTMRITVPVTLAAAAAAARPQGLYRAVDSVELTAMSGSGMKWQPSPSGMLGKYFWPNPTYAFAWGKALTNEPTWYGAGAHILYSPLPRNVHYDRIPIADLSRYGVPDAVMLFVPNYDLPKIPPAVIIGYVPGR